MPGPKVDGESREGERNLSEFMERVGKTVTAEELITLKAEIRAQHKANVRWKGTQPIPDDLPEIGRAILNEAERVVDNIKRDGSDTYRKTALELLKDKKSDSAAVEEAVVKLEKYNYALIKLAEDIARIRP